METDRGWHAYLTEQEVAQALSYEEEIKRLISDLPKGATEEEQEASAKQQISIFENKIMPLKMIAASRKRGIPVEKFDTKTRSVTASPMVKILIALIFVGGGLSYLYLI